MEIWYPSKVGVLEDVIHDPHHLAQHQVFVVEGCHDNGDVWRGLVIDQDYSLIIHDALQTVTRLLY